MRKIFFIFSIFMYSCTGLVDSITNKDLGHGYQYDEVGGYPVIFRDLPNYKVIPAVIISYDFNEDFIIAFQAGDIKTKYNPKISVAENIDFIKRNGSYHYWVVSHQNDSIYGPLNMCEYLKIKKQLDVPDDLKVKVML